MSDQIIYLSGLRVERGDHGTVVVITVERLDPGYFNTNHAEVTDIPEDIRVALKEML